MWASECVESCAVMHPLNTRPHLGWPASVPTPSLVTWPPPFSEGDPRTSGQCPEPQATRWPTSCSSPSSSHSASCLLPGHLCGHQPAPLSGMVVPHVGSHLRGLSCPPPATLPSFHLDLSTTQQSFAFRYLHNSCPQPQSDFELVLLAAVAPVFGTLLGT